MKMEATLILSINGITQSQNFRWVDVRYKDVAKFEERCYEVINGYIEGRATLEEVSLISINNPVITNV